MAGQYTRDICTECARCGTTENLRYDNTLCDSMCRDCWEIFFNTHENCEFCNESVLMPEREEEWYAQDTSPVRCMSLDLGSRFQNKVGCEDCFAEGYSVSWTDVDHQH